MELPLFEEVGDVLRGLLPSEMSEDMRCRAHKYGIKVWFGAPDKAQREHYEAQVISKHAVEGARVLGLEVGFHAEYRTAAENDAVIARLVAAEKKWRKVVGPEPVVGPFLGKADTWRRISETWPDPDLSDPDLPMELGARLADYVSALEPLRR